jgi:uncharacterized protein YdeI (YjbR/CyaY-like superfamily)
LAEDLRPDGLAVVAFGSRAEWEEWLEVEHARSAGVWLKLGTKGGRVASLGYAEALEVSLCWGWIDGQLAAGGEEYFLRRFTPRTARSRWSTRNRATAEELIERGLMRPAGLEQVEGAKADGRWDAAYPGQRDAVVPDEFAAALDGNADAAAFFAALDSANRYAFLYRLHHLKAPAARAERVAQYVEMLARGEQLHPPTA